MDVNLHPLLDLLLQGVTLIVLGTAPILVSRAITAFEKRTGIQLSAQQQKTVHDACDSAAGVAMSMLARGELQVASVHVSNPQIATLAQTALNAVPAAMGAMQLTMPDVAHMVVARIGTLISQDPTIPTVPPPAPAPKPLAG